MKKLFAVAGLLSILVIGGLAGGRFYNWLFPDVAERGLVEAGCDLHSGPCVAHFPGGGSVRLSVNPRPIHPLAPLQLQVTPLGLQATAATVDISGVSMNMGLFRSVLQADAEGFSGNSGLPVCTTSRMDWRAEVRLETARGTLAAAYEFAVERR